MLFFCNQYQKEKNFEMLNILTTELSAVITANHLLLASWVKRDELMVLKSSAFSIFTRQNRKH